MQEIKDSQLIEFQKKTKILIGNKQRYNLLGIIKKKHILLVLSKRMHKEIINDKQLSLVSDSAESIEYLYVENYPELNTLEKEIKLIKNSKYEYIVAIGGGSVIDTSKIIRALALNKEQQNNIKSLIKEEELIEPESLSRLIAVPTTAGTGSEVTPFATLWDSIKKKKYSLSASWIQPDIAIIDPEYLKTLPKRILIDTSLDAINQAFDSIWNNSATDETISLAINSLKNGIKVLPRINTRDLNNEERNAMARVSLQAGLCISKTKTSVCHSISYPITSYFKVPHGLACAFTMNAVTNYIKEHSEIKVTQRWEKISRLTGFSKNDFLNSINLFSKEMKISKSIKKYIPTINHLTNIKEEMYTPERMENFILPVKIEDIERILVNSWIDN